MHTDTLKLPPAQEKDTLVGCLGHLGSLDDVYASLCGHCVSVFAVFVVIFYLCAHIASLTDHLLPYGVIFNLFVTLRCFMQSFCCSLMGMSCFLLWLFCISLLSFYVFWVVTTSLDDCLICFPTRNFKSWHHFIQRCPWICTIALLNNCP